MENIDGQKEANTRRITKMIQQYAKMAERARIRISSVCAYNVDTHSVLVKERERAEEMLSCDFIYQFI